MLGDESRLRYWASSDAAMAGNLSLKGLPLCAMLTKIGKVFMKPFFFPETFFFSVKQNKYIQFKIIFFSKKIQTA